MTEEDEFDAYYRALQYAEQTEDWCSTPRAGVQFIGIEEPDEIVPGRTYPPKPMTLTAAIMAYHEQVAIYGPDNTIAITAFKDKGAGVRELNDGIRQSLGYFDPLPRVGELLMVVKNREDGALNGQRYRAIVVDEDRKLITAQLLGARNRTTFPYKPDMRGPCKGIVEWGYSGTVHKYQGSEADAVIAVVPTGTLKLMLAAGGERELWFFDRSCLYTACSRAKRSLVLIGDPHDIRGACMFNQSGSHRALTDV
jgi:hypothetical protein